MPLQRTHQQQQKQQQQQQQQQRKKQQQLLTHEFIDRVVVVESDEGESSGDSVLFHDGGFLDASVFAEVIFQIVGINVDILQPAHEDLLNLDVHKAIYVRE